MMLDPRFFKALIKALNSLTASMDEHRKNASISNNEVHENLVHADVSLPQEILAFYAAEQQGRQSKNRWELVNRWVGIGGLLVALILAILTYCTLRQIGSQAASAQAQVEIMRQQLETTDRPWIKIIGAQSIRGLAFIKAGEPPELARIDKIHVGLVLTVKNIGHSVALDVALKSALIFTSHENGPRGPFTWPLAQQKLTCAANEPLRSLPINLFPDEESGDMIYVDFDQGLPSANEGLIILPDDPTRTARVSPVIVGCIDYRIPISGKVHHSGFIYELGTLSGNPPLPKTTIFRVGKDVPGNELVMMWYGFGGFDAN